MVIQHYPLKKFFFIILLLGFSLESKTLNVEDISFNVYRNGSKIGFHELRFSDNNNLLKAEINIKFEVTFLGFVVYDYNHQNIENWKDENLISLKTQTDKNGENLFCNFQKNDRSSILNGTAGNFEIYENLIPTSYWNFRLVENSDFKKVINTQDCSYINFKIENLGSETIYNNTINSTHYKLTGKESSGEEVNIDIWYDDRKNWVKMIFIKDGSEIEYFLRDYDKN